MGRKRLFNDKAKWCGKCEKWLLLDAFADNRRTPSGKQNYCKTCHNAYGASFWVKVSTYEQLLQSKYRMNAGDYLEMWRSQHNQCIICGRSLALYHRDTHVHAIGAHCILVCTDCKKGLECFKTADLLRKALSVMDEVRDVE